MVQTLKQLCSSTHLALLGLVSLLGAIGIATLAPPAGAAAVSCRVFTSESAGYEAGAVYSKYYYVPTTSVSGCKDINIRNVQNLQIPGDNCATFKVQFFPTWGNPYYGPSKTICSKDPAGSASGPVVPLATDVLDGTKYRIWYNVENLDWRHSFQVVD